MHLNGIFERRVPKLKPLGLVRTIKLWWQRLNHWNLTCHPLKRNVWNTRASSYWHSSCRLG